MQETAAGHANYRARASAVLSHWLWALPVLLIVSALALRQIDAYPPAADEFYSMFNTGYLAATPYSPLEIVESLQRQSACSHAWLFSDARLLGQRCIIYLAHGARRCRFSSGMFGAGNDLPSGAGLRGAASGVDCVSDREQQRLLQFPLCLRADVHNSILLLVALLLWLYFRIIHGKNQRRAEATTPPWGPSVASLMLTHPLCVYAIDIARPVSPAVCQERQALAAGHPERDCGMCRHFSFLAGLGCLNCWRRMTRTQSPRRSRLSESTSLDTVRLPGSACILNGQAALLVLSRYRRYYARHLETNHQPCALAASVAPVPGRRGRCRAGIIPSETSETNMRYHLVGWLPLCHAIFRRSNLSVSL